MEGIKEVDDGKKVFIRTNSGRQYSGRVQKEDNIFVYIIDKFNNEVRISLRDIEVMEVEA